MFLMYGMAMWAYYNSITIKNDPVSRPCPAPDTRDMDPIYKVCCLCKIILRMLNPVNNVISGSQPELIIVLCVIDVL